MGMPGYLHNACEEIDAALFSGDAAADSETRKELSDYLERWSRSLKEWEVVSREADAEGGMEE